MCDDIRRETSNKDILIGVYAGDVIVPEFPAQISVAFWIELQAISLGDFKVKLRVGLKGKSPVTMQVGINVVKLEIFSLTVPQLQVLVQEEGEILLEVEEDGQWRRLKTKRIVKGDVPQLFMFSNASQPPS